MRLIDADKLIAELNKRGIEYRANINEVITNSPSIDIVRCKDCKWYDETAYSQVRCRCLDRYGEMKGLTQCSDNDFCSYGERRE